MIYFCVRYADNNCPVGRQNLARHAVTLRGPLIISTGHLYKPPLWRPAHTKNLYNVKASIRDTGTKGGFFDVPYIFSREQNLKLDGGEQYIGFDRMAEHYDKSRHLVPDLPKIASDNIARIVGPIENLVDLGSGTGVYAAAFAAYAKRIVAADISTEMLKLTVDKINQEHISNVMPCRINVYRLPISFRSIDVVLAVNIFNLLGQPETAVKEIKRVLCKSGVLVTMQFNVTESPKIDINDEIESLYYNELLKRNIEILKPPGWPAPQLDLELRKHFSKVETVKAKDLQFKIRLSPEYEFKNICSRQYPTQLLLEERIHFEVMDVVDTSMKSKYGSSYRETQLEYKLEVELGFYSSS